MQSDYPEDVMTLAEEALDNLLCNCTKSCGGYDGLRAASISDIARAIMQDRASRSDMTDRPAIKPLQWTVFCSRSGNMVAKTPFGEYVIQIEPDGWCLYLLNSDDPHASYSTSAFAKAAAQADFASRIRSCLLDKPEAVEGVWQPIATAPKDRTKVFLWNEGWLHPVMGYWSPTINAWLEFGSRDTKANAATHWMPLPAVPSAPSTQSATTPADTDAAQCARRKAFEEAAELIEANIVKDSSAGKFLAPRQEGNRDGLHYAAAIRQLAEEEAR